MATRTLECYKKLSDLMDRLEELSPWEYDFVMGLTNHEEQGRLFSAAQMDKIEELHDTTLG